MVVAALAREHDGRWIEQQSGWASGNQGPNTLRLHRLAVDAFGLRALSFMSSTVGLSQVLAGPLHLGSRLCNLADHWALLPQVAFHICSLRCKLPGIFRRSCRRSCRRQRELPRECLVQRCQRTHSIERNCDNGNCIVRACVLRQRVREKTNSRNTTSNKLPQ